MSTEMPKKRKVKLSDRPYVIYTDKTFYSEHGTSLKPSKTFVWLGNHKKVWIPIICVVLALFAVGFIVESLYAATVAAMLFLLVASVVCQIFLYIEGKRLFNYYDDCLKRGGKIVDPWNETYLSPSNRRVSLIIMIAVIVICTTYSIFIITDLTTGNKTSFINIISLVNCSLYASLLRNGNYLTSPTIFLDVNEGVLFGKVIYPYSALKGLSSDSRYDNSFKLTYEGREVATGKILPDDLAYLRSMVEISEKYKDYLVDEGEVVTRSQYVANDGIPEPSLTTRVAR